MKIYFAGSIRGGRDDKALYAQIIEVLSGHGSVLTEHIGNKDLTNAGEIDKHENHIYDRDIAWIKAADVVVAEVTTPSLGVGYELAKAEDLGKPVLCLYRESGDRRVSAMVAGNQNVTSMAYSDLSDVGRIFKVFLHKNVVKLGKFIVLYGINNLGKTTQAEKLVQRFLDEGRKAIYLKYPIYDLEPSGPLLNGYLRDGNPYALSPREAQMLYASNRQQFEPTLRQHLAAGTNIIAEDYTGTGIAWGMGAGVDANFLIRINQHLLKEDMAFLFNGRRFTAAKEKNHKNESNDELMERVRSVHLELGQRFGWRLIDANKSIEEIHETLWTAVQPLLEHPYAKARATAG